MVAQTPDWWKDVINIGQLDEMYSYMAGLSGTDRLPSPGQHLTSLVKRLAKAHPLPRGKISSLAIDQKWHELAISEGDGADKRWKGCNLLEICLRDNIALPQWRWLLRAGFPVDRFNPITKGTVFGQAIFMAEAKKVEAIIDLGLMDPLYLLPHHMEGDATGSLIGTTILDRFIMRPASRMTPEHLDTLDVLLAKTSLRPAKTLPNLAEGVLPHVQSQPALDRLQARLAQDAQQVLDGSTPRPKVRPRRSRL